MEEMISARTDFIWKPQENRPLGRLEVDGNISECTSIFEREGVRVWNGFKWLRIGSNGGLL
jgi:hypothetical protein